MLSATGGAVPAGRSVQESMFQACPAYITLEQLIYELSANLGVSAVTTQAIEQQLRLTNKSTAGEIMSMNHTEMDALRVNTQMSIHDFQSLRICLGSSLVPYQFLSPDEIEDNQTLAQRMETIQKAVHHSNKAPEKKRGGTLDEVSGVLISRREPIMQYHLPDKFVEDSSLNPFRDEQRLRKKIVQEVEAFCGDLYPSEHERSVIFGTVHALCGPPQCGPSRHWDNWRDESRKRHKGTSVCDLERARRNPLLWGVTGLAAPGLMRPARPPPSRLALKTPELSTAGILQRYRHLDTFDSNNQVTPRAIVDLHVNTIAVDDSDDGADHHSQDDAHGLMSEQDLLQKMAELTGQVDELKKKEEEKKMHKKLEKQEESKRKLDAKKNAAAAKKAAAAHKRAGDEENAKLRKRQKKVLSPQQKAPSPTLYEKTRSRNMLTNKAYMELLDKCYSDKLKVLPAEDAADLLNSDKGTPRRWLPLLVFSYNPSNSYQVAI